MMTHPEQRANEVFIGNAARERGHHPRYRHLKTIRVGEKAYTIQGKDENMGHMVPLFVGKSDEAEYNRIWEESLSDVRRG